MSGITLTRTPCSGLGPFEPCARRAQCVNYCHWTVDPRSAFSLCHDGEYPNYIGLDIAVSAVHDGPQLGLFGAQDAA